MPAFSFYCFKCNFNSDGSLGQENPLEEKMVTHSSILTWKTPWVEESGGL